MPEAVHVALKHKEHDGLFAAPVPEGVTEQDVLDAWKPYGWSRAAKSNLDDLLDQPTVDPIDATIPPAEPETAPEGEI